MRIFFRIAVVSLAVLLIAASVTGLLAYRGSKHVPEFYVQAMEIPEEEQEAAGEQLERQMAALATDVKRDEQWQAIFTDRQINGWLAVDLVRKYPQLLPAETKDPRVAIHPDGVRFGCRYEGQPVETVFNLKAQIFLTDEPNVVALRIEHVRAGLVPLPMRQMFEEVTIAARRAGIVVRWLEQNGAPLALVTLPDRHEEIPGRLLLETLELREGEVYVAGRTERDYRAPPPRTVTLR